MRVKCENVVRCANTNCVHNCSGYYCEHTVITLGADGRCALAQSKRKPTPEVRTITKFPDGTESETTSISI